MIKSQILGSNGKSTGIFLNGLQGVIAGADKDQNFQNAQKAKDGKQSKTPALDYFTTDLVQEVRNGKIDPIVGREKKLKDV